MKTTKQSTTLEINKSLKNLQLEKYNKCFRIQSAEQNDKIKTKWKNFFKKKFKKKILLYFTTLKETELN